MFSTLVHELRRRQDFIPFTLHMTVCPFSGTVSPHHTKHDMIRTNSDWNKQCRWGVFVLMNLFVSWAGSKCIKMSHYRSEQFSFCVIHSKRSWMSVYAKASFEKIMYFVIYVVSLCNYWEICWSQTDPFSRL